MFGVIVLLLMILVITLVGNYVVKEAEKQLAQQKKHSH